MSKQKLLEKVAKKYRKEGYDVLVAPAQDKLPDFLRGQTVDLIGRKGNQSVAVQVKRRDELRDVPAFTGVISSQPGWSLDVVVYPLTSEEFPSNGGHQDPEYTTVLIDDAEKLLNQGSLNAALLIAWSATEAVMRE